MEEKNEFLVSSNFVRTLTLPPDVLNIKGKESRYTEGTVPADTMIPFFVSSHTCACIQPLLSLSLQSTTPRSFPRSGLTRSCAEGLLNHSNAATWLWR